MTRPLHVKIPYGPHPSQFLLYYSPQIRPPHPLIVLLHGGFWKSKYGLVPPTAAMETLAPNILSHNYAVAEVEYRRSGDSGWGFPGTNNDVMTAFHVAASRDDVDRARIFIVGHSAGGTLALWLINSLYATGEIQPVRTFAIAPVSDLREAARLKLSDNGDAIQKYVGGEPEEVPEKYEGACPMDKVDILKQTNVTLVAGSSDSDVPESLVRRLFDRVQDSPAGGSCWVYKVFDCDHYQLVSAADHAWLWVVDSIADCAVRIPHATQ